MYVYPLYIQVLYNKLIVILQNIGSKRIYQNASMILINQKYPCINETKTVKKLAEFEFEEAAKFNLFY